MADGERRTDAELTAAYLAAQPAIFAALLDLTAEVLGRLPHVRPESMPRMADFACVLQAVDDVQEWDTLEDLRRRRRHHRGRRARGRPVRQGRRGP